MTDDFPVFYKIPRLTRECTITEKIDGTNALISISENGEMRVGSRTRWITPDDDNYGFAKWVEDNKVELSRLGVGDHYGEWWGSGIQKRYVNQPKTFSLFNTSRWKVDAMRPLCCSVVPILFEGMFAADVIDQILRELAANGSVASPGCMRPEGIIVWHHAARIYFKKTIEKDTEWKGKQ